MKQSSVLSHVRRAAQVAQDKLGEDILILDVQKQSSIADYFLFVGATSHIHVKALEDGIREEMAKSGAKLLRTDGQRGHLWRVLDFGSFIVHVMEHKTREFYAVERLWNQAKLISVAQKKAKTKTVKKRSRKK